MEPTLNRYNDSTRPISWVQILHRNSPIRKQQKEKVRYTSPGVHPRRITPELRSRPIPETKARECLQYMWHRGILGISSQEVANIYVTCLLAVTVLLYVL